MARWHYLDPPLLWLFPSAYAAHVAEETLAGEGFRLWVARLSGRPLSVEGFVVVNALGFAALVAMATVVGRRQSHGWAAVAAATLLSLNAVLHVIGTAATGSYSPGLITGTVLYPPLGALVLVRAGTQARRPELAHGIVVGCVVQALVSGLVLAGLI